MGVFGGGARGGPGGCERGGGGVLGRGGVQLVVVGWSAERCKKGMCAGKVTVSLVQPVTRAYGRLTANHPATSIITVSREVSRQRVCMAVQRVH